jgi:FtsZ-binding cell division protein ZapB
MEAVQMEAVQMEAVQEESIDTLASLEQRITRAVELISNLRRENEQLRQGLTATQQELDDLRSERKQVKARIEKLLGQMDLVSAT